MKSAFIKIFLFIILVTTPLQASMKDEAEEEKSKLLQTRQVPAHPSKNETTTLDIVSDELYLSIFKFLDPHDLGRATQVSKRWKKLTEIPYLYGYTGTRYYGDFLSPENLGANPKQEVVYHYLSVLVNLTDDLKKIERLVSHYRLRLYVPLCKKCLGSEFLADLVTNILIQKTNIPIQKELIAQGNQEIIKRFSVAIQKKIEGLEKGKHGYEKNPLAARDLNELLVKEGDLKSIERKINGLLFGTFGYEMNLVAAREVNDLLVLKGNLEAIERKIWGLDKGEYSYEKNPLAARDLNDLLVKEGNLEAIKRKINGFLFGTFGYQMNLREAKEFNDLLVKEGNLEAIKRKKRGFSFSVTTSWNDTVTSKYRMHGSTSSEDKRKAVEFNEFLVAQGDYYAMWEKIWGLEHGHPGYKSDPSAIPSILELLIEKGDPKAIEIKIEGLSKGKYGYEKDLVAARLLNEFLVKKGNIEAIKRKIKGLVYGYFGYEKNQIAIKEFNEFLLEKGNPEAVQMKLEGLLQGKYGYEKDPEAVRVLLHQFLMKKANIKAIKRQIELLATGMDGYEYDPEISRGLNEFLVERGDPEAFQRKIEGLLLRKYGYEKDPEAARALVHQFLMEEANIKTIERQIEALEKGRDDSKKDPEISREINEFLVERGNLRAITRKIVALSEGGQHTLPFAGWCHINNDVMVPTCGYEKDPKAARALNESLVKKGDLEAIERKMQALLGEATGHYSGYSRNGAVKLTYGYKCDLRAAREFNEFLVADGNTKAIQRKIQGLIEGKYGYKKKPQEARDCIEDLAQYDIPIVRGIGKYLKALALKYGIKELGYQEDRKKAMEFIRENNVPF